MPLSIGRVTCGFLLLTPLLFAAPARADVDAATIGKALVEAVAATGRATLTYQSASASGDTVTLAGVKVATTRNGYTVTVPALVLTGVAPREEGGFRAAGVSLDAGSASVRGDTAAWKTAALANVTVPSAEEVHSGKLPTPFGAFTIAGVTVSGPDLLAPVTVDQAALSVGEAAPGNPRAIAGKASGVHLPTALLSRTFLGAIVHQLDYQEFVAEVTLDATHNPANDTAIVNTLSLDAAGAGKITASGRITDISLSSLINPETFVEAKGKARFETLTVRLDNAGFVERVLALEANMLDYSPDEVRAAWTEGALPIALSVVKDKRFRDQMLTAAKTFLADPRSLTLTLQPQEPIPVGQLARTAVKSPTKLPDLLTPTIQANN